MISLKAKRGAITDAATRIAAAERDTAVARAEVQALEVELATLRDQTRILQADAPAVLEALAVATQAQAESAVAAMRLASADQEIADLREEIATLKTKRTSQASEFVECSTAPRAEATARIAAAANEGFPGRVDEPQAQDSRIELPFRLEWGSDFAAAISTPTQETVRRVAMTEQEAAAAQEATAAAQAEVLSLKAELASQQEVTAAAAQAAAAAEARIAKAEKESAVAQAEVLALKAGIALQRGRMTPASKVHPARHSAPAAPQPRGPQSSISRSRTPPGAAASASGSVESLPRRCSLPQPGAGRLSGLSPQGDASPPPVAQWVA